MTQALFLATRSGGVGLRTVDGVQAVAVNLVSTSNDATVIAAAVAKLNAQAGKVDAFDDHYFDTVLALGDLTSGPVNANNRALVFADHAPAVLA